MTYAAGDQINKFLMQPDQLDLVAKVVQRWPDIRAEVVGRFGDRLKKRIEKELGADVRCDHSLSNGDLPRNDTAISVYRSAWELKEQWVAIRA